MMATFRDASKGLSEESLACSAVGSAFALWYISVAECTSQDQKYGFVCGFPQTSRPALMEI